MGFEMEVSEEAGCGVRCGRRTVAGRRYTMEIKDARRVGGRKAAVACLWVFVLFELVMVVQGSHGDFLTEGRSFMFSQLPPVVVSAVVVAFAVVFFLGRRAGVQLLIEGMGWLRVVAVNWLI